MDKKDEIILQQLEVIRTMTERNLRSMGDDFWGTPFEGVLSPKSPSAPPSGGKPAGSADGKMPAQPSDGKTAGGQPAAKTEKAEEVEPLPKEDMKDLQAELDSYIGLATVKEEVRNLINMASVYKLRRQHDLPTTDMSLHMVFTGNPGTGKTMMARMMARIYRSLDILSKGQLVEVDRSGLVAGYVGQTAIKTQKVIQKALGGVLFIDEAYALNGKSENDFGQEAIDTILKAMEDHRDDLVVIVAGYTTPIPDWNPASTASCSSRTTPPMRCWISSRCSAKRAAISCRTAWRSWCGTTSPRKTATQRPSATPVACGTSSSTFWWPRITVWLPWRPSPRRT